MPSPINRPHDKQLDQAIVKAVRCSNALDPVAAVNAVVDALRLQGAVVGPNGHHAVSLRADDNIVWSV